MIKQPLYALTDGKSKAGCSQRRGLGGRVDRFRTLPPSTHQIDALEEYASILGAKAQRKARGAINLQHHTSYRGAGPWGAELFGGALHPGCCTDRPICEDFVYCLGLGRGASRLSEGRDAIA